MSFEDVVKWLDNYTRNKDADKSKAGGVGVARKIDEAFKGTGQKYSDPNKNEKVKELKRVKTMAERYASGKEADRRMKAAADRRIAKKKASGRSYAMKTTKGKGSSPFDSREDQVKYANEYKKGSERGDRPTGTRQQRIEWRIKNKDYKGQYYGPDRFKGDLKKIRAWKKAGKPPLTENSGR